MFNKNILIEVFEDEIKEAIESGDYETAETLERVVAKCRRSTVWRLFFTGCVYMGYALGYIIDLAKILIAKFR